MSEERDYARYEGKKLRNRIYKDLNNNVTMERLELILKADRSVIKTVYELNVKDGYTAGRPDGSALCWDCKWCTGKKNGEGKVCPWAHDFQNRNDWMVEDEWGDDGVLEKRCVCQCGGFELGCVELEKKYLITILYSFFKHVDSEAFSINFFVKAKTNVFNTWLDLYNRFRVEVLNLKPFVRIQDYNF